MTGALLCLVIAIADGDTLTARCGSAGAYQDVRVRLAEIDAPEKRQPFGTQSRQNLSDLCFKEQATIHPKNTDRYGRTIARVECRGVDASAYQAQSGMAWAYTKYLTDFSVIEHENGARAKLRGLWSMPSHIPPWEWRHGVR